MREIDMSTRAFGTAIGTSEATVRREISSASNDPVAEPRTAAREVAAGVSFGAPAPVTGTDGKTYTPPIKP